MALVAACGSETVRPDTDASLSLASRQAWAGGTLDVYSAAFQGSTALPVVLLDSTAFSAVRINDTTLRVAIPGDYAGEYLVSATVDGRFVTGPAVEVAGYLGARPLGTQLRADHYSRWDPSARPLIVAAQSGNGALVDLSDGTVRQLPIPLNRLGSPYLGYPGAGYLPGTLLAPDTVPGRFILYAVGLEAQPIDTIITTTEGVADPIVTSLLGPGTIVTGMSKYLAISTAAGVRLWYATFPGPLVFSPHRDFATYTTHCDDFRDSRGPGGHPVFSVPSGDIAFVVPSPGLWAAAFDPSGTMLAVGAASGVCFNNNDAFPVIRRYRLSDGQPVDSVQLPRSPLDIAYDPVRPYLYVALEPSALDSIPLRVLVLDATTLAPVGEMTTDFVGDPSYERVAIAVGADNTLYLIDGLDPIIARFALPPR